MPVINEYKTYLSNGVGTVSGTVCLRSYNGNRKSIMIQNLGTATLYIGGSGVTDTNGIQINVNENIILNSAQGAAIYCYSDGTSDIRFVEEMA